MKTLVIFSKDWADEFEVKSFQIFDRSPDEVKEILLEEVVGQAKYFGTNEGWEDGEIELDDFEIKEISDKEADVISSLLGTDFGTASILWSYS